MRSESDYNIETCEFNILGSICITQSLSRFTVLLYLLPIRTEERLLLAAAVFQCFHECVRIRMVPHGSHKVVDPILQNFLIGF